MSNNNYMGKIDKDLNPKGVNYYKEEPEQTTGPALKVSKKYKVGQFVDTVLGHGQIKEIKKLKKGFCYFVQVHQNISAWLQPL